MCTSENARMVRQSTERGLNLYFCASKHFIGAEISISCGILELSAWFFSYSDCLFLDDITNKSSLRASWLVMAPAFLQVSVIVVCLSFSSLFELADGDEDFPLFLFLFWEIISLPLSGRFTFSNPPTLANSITGDNSQWEQSSGRSIWCRLRQLSNKHSTNLHHQTRVRYCVIVLWIKMWLH